MNEEELSSPTNSTHPLSGENKSFRVHEAEYDPFRHVNRFDRPFVFSRDSGTFSGEFCALGHAQLQTVSSDGALRDATYKMRRE
jgi:hypothetical protein